MKMVLWSSALSSVSFLQHTATSAGGMMLGLCCDSCIHKPAQQQGSGHLSTPRDGPAGGQEGWTGESQGSARRTEAGAGTKLCRCSG